MASACPRCGTSWPAGQPFCGSCGARLPDERAEVRRALVRVLAARAHALAPAPVRAGSWPVPENPDPSGMRICPSCGAIAPSKRTSCVLCRHEFGSDPPVAPAPPERHVLAMVRCSFTCRGCGLPAPLDFLDVDGRAECAGCGLTQAFAKESWQKALDHAHAVADLAGPRPEGRLGRRRITGNPFAGIGVEHTFAEYSGGTVIISGGGVEHRSIKLSASPGHPLCARCRLPLVVVPQPLQHVATLCSGCGDSAKYRLPRGVALGLCAGLRGVIAPEHRVDRQEVRVTESAGGAVAILCPVCSAALPATTSEIVTCQFCQTPARVPQRTLRRLRTADPEPAPFWLLFSGAAPARQELERAAARQEQAEAKWNEQKRREREDAEEDEDDAADAVAPHGGLAAAAVGAPAAVLPAPAAALAGGPDVAAASGAPPRAPAKSRLLWVIVAAAMALLILCAGSVLMLVLWRQQRPGAGSHTPTPTWPVQPRRR